MRTVKICGLALMVLWLLFISVFGFAFGCAPGDIAVSDKEYLEYKSARVDPHEATAEDYRRYDERLDRLYASTVEARRPPKDTRIAAEHGDEVWFCRYIAQPRRVIDGDTAEFLVELGLGTYRIEIVRLRGINTPEMKGATLAKAKEFAAELARMLTEYPVCIIETRNDQRDNYGRPVVVIYPVDQSSGRWGKSINKRMLDSSKAHAVPFMED